MSIHRAILITGICGITICSSVAMAQSNAPATSGIGPKLTLEMPALPDPVQVTLKPAATALLLSDVIDPTCKVQPQCTGVMLPAIAMLLAKARKAGVSVLYSTRAANASKWLPEVVPAPGDHSVPANAQDRFYESDLDQTLKAKGITTLILVGWKISGSILYTSVGATLRGYTVVVPKDASLGPTDYEEAIGLYQILNQSSSNAKNEPLKAGAPI
jgi:nicotinamidase-related amidase